MLTVSFKNHSATIEEEHYDEHTGKTKRRYVNRGRFVGYALTKISQNAPLGEISKGPSKAMQDRLNTLDPQLMHRLLEVSGWQRLNTWHRENI